MIAASVGFQCPDDVRRGQEGVRPARTSYGGRLSADTSRVTQVLVGLNVLVYLVQLATPDLVVRFGNLGLAVDGGKLIGVAEGQWYRLLTAAFLHAGFVHILSNMFALITLGPQLEAALGRTRFLALYVLAALGGSTLSFLVSDPGTLGVGASGAIFGLFGGFYVLVRRVGGETGPIVGLIVLNLVITFALPIIDWRAHLGGLVTGAAVSAAFAYAPPGPRRTLVQVGACAVVLALVAVAVLVRTADLRG
jgi:membrane associated rhomboid family serine protease